MHPRTFGTIFATIGVVIFLVLAGIATPMALAHRHQDATWTTTTGRIVDVDTRRDRDGDVLYRPHVAYVAGEAEHTCVPNFWTNKYAEVGGEQAVLYDPASPSRCDVPTVRWVSWLLGGMGTFFLLLFGGIGLFMRAHPERFRSTGNGFVSSWSSGAPYSSGAQVTDEYGRPWASTREGLHAENERLREENRRLREQRHEHG